MCPKALCVNLDHMSDFSCGVQNIHPGNKKNFYVSIFVTLLYIFLDYQPLLLCEREAC